MAKEQTMAEWPEEGTPVPTEPDPEEADPEDVEFDEVFNVWRKKAS